MESIQEQLKGVSKNLHNLSIYINTRNDIERLHRDNIFNRRFSAMLSSYIDFETVALRLERNVKESREVEHSIRVRMEGLMEIPDELQPAMRIAVQLTREMQADFKSLYMFGKIFLDEYTTLLTFIHNWRGISTGSITSIYNSFTKYAGSDPQVLRFKASCYNRLRASDVFITQYRDKYVVHDQTEHKEARWFINDMNGDVRILGSRPSITPKELVFVVAGYVEDTTAYTKSDL